MSAVKAQPEIRCSCCCKSTNQAQCLVHGQLDAFVVSYEFIGSWGENKNVVIEHYVRYFATLYRAVSEATSVHHKFLRTTLIKKNKDGTFRGLNAPERFNVEQYKTQLEFEVAGI